MSISRLILFLRTRLHPHSGDEDVARREFILYVFVTGVLVLLLFGVGIDTIHYFVADPDTYRETRSLPWCCMPECFFP